MARRNHLSSAKLQLDAGNASMMELGKMLGPIGVNLVDVKRTYDAATAGQRGEIVPVVVTVFEDKSFELRYATPPTSFLIRQELGIDRGSSQPGHHSAPQLSEYALRRVAERKLADLNTDDIETAMRIVSGTARSMGVGITT